MNGASKEQNSEDVHELAAIDALGLLTDRERRRLEAIEEESDPQIGEEIRQIRHAVLSQMRDDLPDVDPDPSLKHRVLGSVLQFIERDYERTLQQRDREAIAGTIESEHRNDWIERIVSGRVSPVWRVAALIMITISVGLFWILAESMQANREMRQLARGNESRELFERHIGPDSIDFVFFGDRVGLVPAAQDSPTRAMIAYLPKGHKGLFLADQLPAIEDDEIYEVHVSTPDLEEVVIRFTSRGQFISLDFDIPETIPNPMDARWWVNLVNGDGETEIILETL